MGSEMCIRDSEYSFRRKNATDFLYLFHNYAQRFTNQPRVRTQAGQSQIASTTSLALPPGSLVLMLTPFPPQPINTTRASTNRILTRLHPHRNDRFAQKRFSRVWLFDVLVGPKKENGPLRAAFSLAAGVYYWSCCIEFSSMKLAIAAPAASAAATELG